MPDYDFKSLSSYDFECLVRDLLQKELCITLESFKTGRDQGIDLRYAKTSKKSLIVQCKHYAESGYKLLQRHLRADELGKIKILKPKRYVLVTSVPLTPLQKDKLQTLLAPHCTSASDIYGKQDVNNLLGKFPEIEQQHFKLWLTSKAVLDRVMHSQLFNQSQADIERIQQRLRYYVQNDSYVKAKGILAKHHYCVIAGCAGIGKTTLAEILLADYLANGYEAFTVSADITEGFRVLETNSRQVFYYDDFLGQTSLEAKLGKNEDQQLLRFIDSVRRSENARFILTTREYILNQAKATYEKLDRSDIDLAKCIISLEGYTRFQKGKILFNHLYFSKLPETCKLQLLQERGYRRVIDHRNYSPRIIEFMTDDLGMIASETSYLDEFLKNLDYPIRLWQHIFDQQLSNAARHLLITLASFPRYAVLDHLEKAFDAFYGAQSRKYRFACGPQDYRKALRVLDGDFLTTAKAGRDTVVHLHNPSMRDFLETYLSSNASELFTLWGNTVYLEQCRTLWHIGNPSSERPIRTALKTDPDMVISRIQRTFNSSGCAAQLSAKTDGTTESFRLWFPFEGRLGFLVSVAQELKTQAAALAVSSMVPELICKTEDEDIEPESLVSFIRTFEHEPVYYGLLRAELINAATLFLKARTDSMEAFSLLRDFSECVGFAAHERLEIASEFAEFYDEDMSRWFEDENPGVDELREYIDALRDNSQHFGVVAYGAIMSLEERLEELESVGEPDYDYDGARPRIESAPSEDADISIDCMFDSLLGHHS